MKGIVLAGGFGTRLYPLTIPVSKQLLPVYDKPMVYYPLSVMMLSGIRDILIISTEHDIGAYKKLLGDGKNLGVNFQYATQTSPKGLPDAFIVGADFIGEDRVCLILGDNIVYGQGVKEMVQEAASKDRGATIFGYYVKDPQRYGVVEFDNDMKVISLEEKPKEPRSDFAIVGLYFFDNRIVEIARSLKPSRRGETEIIDAIRAYHDLGELEARIFGRGIAWLDTGTHESLMEASTFIEVIEKRQGMKIACLEEVAFRMGYIGLEELDALGDRCGNSSYGKYIRGIVERTRRGGFF